MRRWKDGRRGQEDYILVREVGGGIWKHLSGVLRSKLHSVVYLSMEGSSSSSFPPPRENHCRHTLSGCSALPPHWMEAQAKCLKRQATRRRGIPWTMRLYGLYGWISEIPIIHPSSHTSSCPRMLSWMHCMIVRRGNDLCCSWGLSLHPNRRQLCPEGRCRRIHRSTMVCCSSACPLCIMDGWMDGKE